MRAWLSIRHAVRGARERLETALERPLVEQQALLRDILADHRDTDVGRAHGFAGIGDYETFAARLPIRDYESMREDIQAQAEGRGARLCRDIRFFELTGGSTAGPKLIPYTAKSLAALQRAIHAWLEDLLLSRPGIMEGPAYWSISPVTRPPGQTVGDLPLGQANDMLYFGEELVEPLLETLAVPPALATLTDIESWRLNTLYYLLCTEDLALISVWSPSFILELLRPLEHDAERLIRAVHEGRLPVAAQGLTARPADAERAQAIACALKGDRPDTRRLWPELDTLSCWTDARSGAMIGALLETFPHVHVQGKGLLSTEGIVSIPLSEAPAPVLTVQSAFYEFQDEKGAVHLCDDLTPGRIYRLIMTTQGGLYRYDTGDMVRIEGYYKNTPTLRFIGRGNRVSDLCGEKLCEAFVSAKLEGLPGFAMLAPADGPHAGYALYVDAQAVSETEAIAIGSRLDQALRANPQYDQARALGQLRALTVVRIEKADSRYVSVCLQRGQTLGDIKPPALSTETGWSARLGLPG